MKYGEAIALRCNEICREKGITLNKLASIDVGQHRKGEHEESFIENVAQDRNGPEHDRGRVPRFRRNEQHDIRGRII